MWFLECEGDLFEHKRLWLRPGTKHILGRTSKPDEGQRVRYIENGSVSRKHLTVDIDTVPAGESTHLHAKTRVTLTDNSKVGTWLNDERLEKTVAKPLDRNDNKIKLGNYQDAFRIKWQPLVFSFPSLPRASRQLDDPLSSQRRVLEPLGIKCVVDYVTQYTSHLVVKKRNTPSTLQALVNARYIITEDYLHELRHLSLDALEQDFTANWPSEEPYSPPPGNEPNPRPDKSPDFLPNSQRSEIFSQYTFVFSDPGQHTTLMPVITGGGGKALCHAVDIGSPNPQDLLEYVREVAGKKSERGFNLTQQPKTKGGIVVVRIGGAKDFLPGFYEQLDSSLGQSSVEQNELLEVILDVDASKLKRPAEIVQTTEDTNMENGTESPPPRRPSERLSRSRQSNEPAADAPSATPNEPAPESPQPAPTTTRRRGRRPLTQTKFKGFDEIDMNSLPKYRSPSPSQPPSYEPSQAPSEHVMEDEIHPSQSQPVPSQPSQRAARKRPPPEDEESHQDVMASMLKGAAAMKKRRIAEGREEARSPVEPVVEEEDIPAPVIKKPKKRKDKEVDVRAVMQERRQAEEEARRVDEENLRNALEGMDVNEIRNLAQVEEMDIIRRDPPRRSRYNAEGGHDDRWDDRWNGRKNFKRFRRQGTTAHTQNRPRVFVSLEEVEPNTYGVTDDYFLVSSSHRSKKSQKKGRSQQNADEEEVEVTATPASGAGSQSQTQTQAKSTMTNSISLISDSDKSEDDATTFRRRIRASRAEDAEHTRAEEIIPEEIAGTARDRDIADAARLSKSSASSRTQPGKRTSKGVVEDSQPRKRQTRIRRPSPDEVSEDDDDEEDETRFRRRKR